MNLKLLILMMLLILIMKRRKKKRRRIKQRWPASTLSWYRRFYKIDFRPGVYRHAADRRFPGSKRGYLPIVAEDYTYTMDVMFINFIIEENILKEKISQRKTYARWIVQGHGQVGDTPVIGGLILVETASRRFSFTGFILKIPEKFSMLSSFFFLR